MASFAALLNPGVCMGGQQDAVDGKGTGGCGCTIQAGLIVMDARPRPVFRAARQPRPHRIQMNRMHRPGHQARCPRALGSRHRPSNTNWIPCHEIICSYRSADGKNLARSCHNLATILPQSWLDSSPCLRYKFLRLVFLGSRCEAGTAHATVSAESRSEACHWSRHSGKATPDR